MELDYSSMESKVCSDHKPTSECHELLHIPESSNDFLEQIEGLDPSGLATSLIEILQSTKRILLNKKGIIDIVTHDRILTEFLQRTTDLVNREMKTGEYDLKMENEDDSNRNN